MLTLLVALLAAPQAATAPAPPAQRSVRRAPVTSTDVEIRVTDRTGAPAPGVRIIADGPSSREGESDAEGAVTLRTLTFGTYRFHAEGEGFVALEKEVAIRTERTPAIEFALSRAPEKKDAIEKTPAAEAPAVTPGKPLIVSLLDVAEDALAGKDAVRTVAVGCSGLSRAQLLVVRDSLEGASRQDADDMLYMIAGEASIALAGRTQTVSSGHFSVVPRGTAHTITRRGRNPAILLSIVGGVPCAE